MASTSTVDQDRLQAFLQRFAADQAAAVHAATVVLGDQLGLYEALAAGGPQASGDLAEQVGCHPRLVREWLNAQAASGYCEYDPATGHYALTPEQVACLADRSSPTFVAGNMLAANAAHRTEARVRRAFTGDGAVGWGEHPDDLFDAVERSFRGHYAIRLVPEWIPALDGMQERLRAGGRVADIGCGYGTTTILLAQAFPASAFSGFDTHGPSIQAAREAAAEAGVSDRVTFEVAAAGDIPDEGYDLVCIFNALHEFGDPVGATRRMGEALDADGSLLIVEPNARDRVEDNTTAVSRNFYSISTLVCVPNALAQGATGALGAQVGDAELRQVTAEAGFTRFRRVAETPLHRVLEARP